MGNSTTVTATLKILADVSSAQSSVSKLASTFSKIKFSDSLKSEMSAAFSKFDKQVEEFKTKLQQPIETKGQANTLNKGAQEIKKSYDEILKYIKSAEKELTAEGVDLSKIFKIDGSTQGKITELNNQIKNLKKVFQDFGNVDLAKATDGSFATLKTNAGDAGKSIQTIAEAAESATRKVQTLGQGKFTLSDNAKDAVTQFTTLETTINSITTKSNQDTRLGIIEALNKGDLETAQKKLQELYSNYERLASRQGDSETWQKNILAVGTALEAVNSLLNATNNATSGLETEKFKIINDAVTQMIEALAGAVAGARNTQGAIDGVVSGTRSMTEAQLEYNSSMEQMKSRIQYFFSINNAVQLLQRTLRSAFDTVKELDAAMTETATVTDFSVSDMWDQLPRYTQAANELGTTTLGAYETMTLFYQQGLDTNEVFQIGTETMKMARIAGLDYEDATNKMTAALRGFNMELNETSATRVNDVYSELAAITAADTEEIATAMTKTASIADSANMEFETTSAFLSQIIETTRESAETAGTAMKTIVARFQELKKDPAEIELVDGESVDANKIETALRSVGVALRDTEGQFRDLDDVFLDLASRWDSLDLNTQRYIATMAAGSRQQSRFIAMMQDYDRTMELVNAAYDSNGSSQKQFEKTTESLESKLNELKNAWNEFAMGIANSDIIKGGVDLLTQIITIFNKITQSGNSLWSMVKKLTAAFAGFKTAKVLLNGLLSGFTSLKTGDGLFDGIFSGLKKTATKEFSGLATIFKRVFTQQGWKGTDSYNSILGGLTSGAAQTSASTYESALERSRVAATNLQQAELNLKKAQEARAKAEQAFAASGRNQSEKKLTTANVTRAEATAQQEVAAAKTENAAATAGLNAVEQNYIASKELLTGLEQAGLSTEQMAVLLSDEKTRAILEQAVAEGALSDVLKDEAIQQQLNNQIQQQGILGKIKARLVTLSKVSAEELEAAVEEKVKNGKEAATAAQEAYNAVALKGLGVLGLYVLAAAAVAAAIIGIVIAVKKAKANSLEGQLESAQKATERATEAAQNAKDAYDELLNGQGNYNSTQEALNELTEGTDEFKQALIEANQAVIELIGTYKGLEVSKGDFGQLTITDASWDKVIEQQWQTVQNANSGQLTAQIREAQLDYEKAVSSFTPSISYEHKTRKQQTDVWLQKGYETDDIDFNEKLLELYQKEGESADLTSLLLSQVGWNEADIRNVALDLEEDFSVIWAQYEAAAYQLEQTKKGYVSALVESSMDWDEYNFSDDIKEKLTDTMVGSNIFGEDITQEIDKTINKTFGELSEAVQDSIEGVAGEKSITDLNKKQLKEVYADLMNISVDEIPDELAKSKTKLQEAIVNIDLGNTLAEKFEEIFDVLDDLDSDTQEILTDLFSGSTDLLDNSGEDISKALKQYVNKGGSWTQLAETLGITADSAQDLADILAEQVNANVRQLYQDLGVSLSFIDTFGSAGERGLTGVNAAEVVKTWSFAEQRQSLNAANSIQSAYGKNATASYWNLMLGLDTSDARAEVNSFISSINLSNPIKAFSTLQDAVNNGSEEVSKLAQSFLALENDVVGATAQMQYFLKSSDFSELQDSLEDFIDETGEISADNIRDLSKQSSTLKELLDNDTISATGLARVLTEIQNGTLSFYDLNDSILASVKNMGSLDDIASQAISTLENFNPGKDESYVAEEVSGAAELFNENLENGHIGNSQLESWAKLLLGDDVMSQIETNEEAYERYSYIADQLEKNSDNMFHSFSQMAAGVDFWGNSIEGFDSTTGMFSKEIDGVTTDLFSIKEQYNELGQLEIDLSLAEGSKLTSEEVQKYLAELYGVSEQYAAMMLADFKNNSWELRQMLDANDFYANTSEMYNSLESTEIGSFQEYTTLRGEEGVGKSPTAVGQLLSGQGVQGKIVDEQTIKISAELQGKSKEDLTAELQKIAEENGEVLVVTHFYTEEGEIKTGQDFWDEFERVSGLDINNGIETKVVVTGAEWDVSTSGEKTWVSPIEEEIKTLDLNTAFEGLEEGTGQSISNLGPQVQEMLTNAMNQGVEQVTWTYNGEELVIPIDEADTLESLQSQIEEFENSIDTSSIANQWANEFATVFADGVSITIEYPDGEITEKTQADLDTANATVNANPITVEPQYSSFYDTFVTDLNQAINHARNNPVIIKEITYKTTKGVEGAMATGTSSSPISGTALGGEEGPELHLTKSGAEIVGANGPELFHIEKKDVVYTASQTRKILGSGDNSKRLFPRYAGGYGYVPIEKKWSATRSKGSGYSGTGSTSGNVSATSAAADAEEAAEIWENTFDWLYNLTEDINEILRDREKLEREYDRILAKRNTTAKQLFDNVQDQLGVLETERQKQQEMYDKRAWEMQDYLSKNSDLAKYATYNWDDMTIEIDWDRIDAVTDEDTGEAIEDYVSKLEDIQDEMDDAEDELAEIEDRIQELLEMGKEEYFDFENLVFEALQAQKQALIDNASDISEAITDTNSNLLSSLSDSISRMREDRDLEDDRTSLEDQQKKLIYLQQDTSGGNALEILKLQQDIEDAQQSYTDKLIDRKIDELQQQNDEASEQRERQIELAQEQLDQWSQSQEKWNEIHALWASSLNPNGTLVTDSVIMNALKDKDNYKGLSEYAQMDWLGTIEDDLATGLTWLANERQLEKIGKTSGEITFTDAQGEKHTGTINSDGSVSYRGIDNNGKEGTYTWKDVYENFDGSYRTFESIDDAKFIEDKPKEEEKKDTGGSNNNSGGLEVTNKRLDYAAAAVANGGYGWGNGQDRKDKLTEVFGPKNAVEIQRRVNKYFNGTYPLSSTLAEEGGYYYNTVKNWTFQKYKTGGLADYTGPAWLDGTPSKPEIVLNAQDTKNFITLKNVLASLMSAPGAESTTNSTSNGDNYYDINISVESVSNDYDVEQIANKVESMIVQDGLYRNVNSINRLK